MTISNNAEMAERMRRHRLQGLAEMAAGMAHEINQPLSGIRGFAEGILIGLEEGWDISKQEILEKMKRIVDESDRIDSLIQSVRGFADENARLEMMRVDLYQVVQAAMRLWGTRLRARGIELSLTCTATAWVRANPFALQEVVQIVLTNAGDACLARVTKDNDHGGHIAIAIDGGADEHSPAIISIHDNGIGMDAAILARVGEPFFTTKGPDRGLGLGLSVARGILAQCGGELALQSTLGTGTTVNIRLCQRPLSKEST
jgi:signal transduction histidine kinase